VSASVVVIHHLILVSVVSLAAVYVIGAHPTGVSWLLSETPLHIFWDGPDFVVVFFVLSGLVLSMAAAAGAPFRPASYYSGRFVRLYLPVWGSLVIAAIAHVVVSHGSVHGATFWLNEHSGPLTVRPALHDLTLVDGAGDGEYATVLWSLRWEVTFSILLPVFLFVGSWIKPAALIILTLVVMAVAGVRFQSIYCMSPFMLGVALAFGRDRIVDWMTGPRACVLMTLSVCGLTAHWWLGSGIQQHIAVALIGFGATALVAVAMCPGVGERLFGNGPVEAIGRRSFSLYLVHEPILVAIAFALGGKPNVIVLAAISVPFIAAVTEVFYRYVERPAHTVAKATGRSVAQRVAAPKQIRLRPIQARAREVIPGGRPGAQDLFHREP
jgi:peptidoglycan/LPS O-acetylase OafA/YrhL